MRQEAAVKNRMDSLLILSLTDPVGLKSLCVISSTGFPPLHTIQRINSWYASEAHQSWAETLQLFKLKYNVQPISFTWNTYSHFC